MSKIVSLDPTVDLWLSYTWSNNPHGICGHTYEVVDYYWILSKHINCGILIGDNIPPGDFVRAVAQKYNFTDSELNSILAKTKFVSNPRLVRGRNILFTDGGVINAREMTLLFDNILFFACGNKEVKDNTKDNVFILQDDRVYDEVRCNGIDYKKRILFDKLRTPTASDSRALVYATKNCRNIQDFESLLAYGKDILAITNRENRRPDTDRIKFVIPPVPKLIELFDTFIYTPVERKWDCSPRFIAECKYYNKQVIFHNIDYWDEDAGLFWRNWDIENDFDSLFLRDDDSIVDIVKQIIC